MDRLLVTLLALISTASAAGISYRDTTCTPGPINANNRQCTIECGVDHAGGDYLAKQVVDFQGCIDACTNDSSCKTAQYLTTNSYCYLKSAIAGPVSNSIVNGVVCPDPSSSSPSATTTASTSSSTSSSVAFTTITTSITTTMISSLSTPSSLSSDTTTLSAAPTVITTSSSSSSFVSTSVSTTSVCNSNSFPTTTIINGRTAQVMCDRDSSGGDYSNMYAATFQACENACAADPQCNTAVWVLSTQYCYLKTFMNGYFINSGISWIYFPPVTTTSSRTTTSSVTKASTTASTIASTTPLSTTKSMTTTTTPVMSASTTPLTSTTSSTTTSKSSTTTTSTSCMGTYTTISNRTAVVQCGFDRPGGDLMSVGTYSLKACEQTCANNPQCVTAQFNGGAYSGTCYLKSGANQLTRTSGVDGIIFYNASAPVTASPGCLPTAPPTPFLLNGGWENGYNDLNNCWRLTNGTSFEGCASCMQYPLGSTSQPRYSAFIQPYSPLQMGQTYNVSFSIGRPISAISSWASPTFTVSADGNRTLSYNNTICGWSDTGACPITGSGGAVGQFFSTLFTATVSHPFTKGDASQSLTIGITWFDAGYDYVMVDDIRIVPTS